MEIKPVNGQKDVQINYILLGGALLSVFLIISILIQLQSNGQIIGDKALNQFVSTFSNSVIVTIFTIFTELGSKYGIGGLFLLSLLVFWIKFRDYAAMAVVALCVLGGDQVNKLLKEVVGRERPLIDPSIYAEGYSFPSGHAMVGLTFYGFIAFYIITLMKDNKTKLAVTVSMGILIFLIGFSRIILQAHYPSDVFGGFAIGFLYLLIAIYIYRFLGRKRKWPR